MNKHVACAVGFVVACVIYYVAESVSRLKETHPDATLGTWIRTKIYRRGFIAVCNGGRVECNGNCESVAMMMVACYRSLKASGFSLEELWEALEGDAFEVTDCRAKMEGEDDENAR